jgi:hypothetical protein
MEKQLKEYKLLSYGSVEHLNDEVNRLLKLGWQLYFGSSSGVSRSDYYTDRIYSQAMVLYEDKK